MRPLLLPERITSVVSNKTSRMRLWTWRHSQLRLKLRQMLRRRKPLCLADRDATVVTAKATLVEKQAAQTAAGGYACRSERYTCCSGWGRRYYSGHSSCYSSNATASTAAVLENCDSTKRCCDCRGSGLGCGNKRNKYGGCGGCRWSWSSPRTPLLLLRQKQLLLKRLNMQLLVILLAHCLRRFWIRVVSTVTTLLTRFQPTHGYTATNAAGIAANVTRLDTHEGLVTTNIANIQTNTDGIAANVARLDVHEGLLTQNIADIAANKSQIASNQSQIASLGADVYSLRSGFCCHIGNCWYADGTW